MNALDLAQAERALIDIGNEAIKLSHEITLLTDRMDVLKAKASRQGKLIALIKEELEPKTMTDSEAFVKWLVTENLVLAEADRRK